MFDVDTAEPIALRDSLTEVMAMLRRGEVVESRLITRLHATLRRQWRTLDCALRAKESSERVGKGDALRMVEFYLKLHDNARRDARLLILQLNAINIDGHALYLVFCQERESIDFIDFETFEDELCLK